jgi:inner membrane protein
VAWSLRSTAANAYVAIVSINLFVHLVLDTVVGKIRWFYPLSSRDLALFEVDWLYDRWMLNFILHWTFLFELVIVFAAMYCFARPWIRNASITSWNLNRKAL